MDCGGRNGNKVYKILVHQVRLDASPLDTGQLIIMISDPGGNSPEQEVGPPPHVAVVAAALCQE